MTRQARPPRPAAEGLRLEPADHPDQIILSWPIGTNASVETLTGAELEVLIALLRGETDEAIAESRKTSVRTVAVQVQRIYRKLGVSGRRAVLALFAAAD